MPIDARARATEIVSWVTQLAVDKVTNSEEVAWAKAISQAGNSRAAIGPFIISVMRV